MAFLRAKKRKEEEMEKEETFTWVWKFPDDGFVKVFSILFLRCQNHCVFGFSFELPKKIVNFQLMSFLTYKKSFRSCGFVYKQIWKKCEIC